MSHDSKNDIKPCPVQQCNTDMASGAKKRNRYTGRRLINHILTGTHGIPRAISRGAGSLAVTCFLTSMALAGRYCAQNFLHPSNSSSWPMLVDIPASPATYTPSTHSNGHRVLQHMSSKTCRGDEMHWLSQHGSAEECKVRACVHEHIRLLNIHEHLCMHARDHVNTGKCTSVDALVMHLASLSPSPF